MRHTFKLDPLNEDNLFWQVICQLQDYLDSRDDNQNINLVYFNPVNDGFEAALVKESDVSVDWNDVRVLPLATLEIDEIGFDRIEPGLLDAFAADYKAQYKDGPPDPPAPPVETEPVEPSPPIMPSPNVSATATMRLYEVGQITMQSVREAIKKFSAKHREPTFLRIPKSTPFSLAAALSDEFGIDVSGGAEEGQVLLV